MLGLKKQVELTQPKYQNKTSLVSGGFYFLQTL